MHARCSVTYSGWIAIALACLTRSALAQQYRTDPVDKRAYSQRSIVLDSLNNPAAYAANKDGAVVEFFTKWYFPSMTQTDPNDLGNLATTREELFRKYILATSNPEYQRQLTLLAYKSMLPIVASLPGNPPQPPYDPAVRFNAVLVLNQLDENYGGPGGPEKPLPEANRAEDDRRTRDAG